MVTVKDSLGETASAQVSLCDSAPTTRPAPLAQGDPGYKKTVGCPVHVDNGNMFTHPQRDLFIPGRGLPLEFTRMYNSRSTIQFHMGYGWNHTYHRFLMVTPDGGPIIYKPDGSAVYFKPDGGGGYYPLYGEKSTVEKLPGGAFVHREKNGIAYLYEPAEGRLLSITDPNGNALQLSYAYGLLTAVTDAAGRALTFTYNNHHQVETVTDPAGRVFRYDYDAADNLARVTYPDGTARTYEYNDPHDPHNLTAILDENGNEVESHLYDDQDRAVTSCKAGCRESVALSFNDPEPGKTTVTDGLGNRTIYRYDEKTGAILSAEESDGTRTEYGWDEQLNQVFFRDRRGNATTYTYDEWGNVLSATDSSGAVTTYAYDPVYNHPTRRTEPATSTLPPGSTQFFYDDRGNLIRVVDPLGETTTLTYDSAGQLLRIDGPRTDVADVTEFAYDAFGDLVQVTNALGQATRYTYDDRGNLTSVADPNGNVIRYAYDLRDRVVEVSRPDGGTIRNTYDAAGNLTGVTKPKGNQSRMSYNPINRLLELKDPLGNTITYSYDPEGRKTARALSDPGGAVTLKTDYAYDPWNRLTAVTEADGASTAYAYDPEGNRISATDPNGNKTLYEYDGKNRLLEITDPAGGVTQYAYDSRGNLTRVRDPRGNATTYAYDEKNRLVETDSIDTGRTNYEYNPAGNLIRKTDGRGVVTTYTYDALNRLQAVSHPDPSEDSSFQYDEGGNGLGRLTEMRDPAGVTAFSYDPTGRLIAESFTSGGTAALTQYAYDLNGNLTGLTLPSGRLVEYAYDPSDRLSEVAAQVGGTRRVLASDFSYLPFGPWKTMTQGNGLATAGDYDQRYRLVNYAVGTDTLSYSYAYDPAGNITAIVNNLQPGKTRRFGYDPADRLQYGEGSWGALDYGYDPAGNRITETRNGALTSYFYQGNQLAETTGAQTQSFTYDGAGNTARKITPSLTTEYVYNQNGRMIRALSNGAVAGEYRYDALGRRRVKTAGGKSTLFHFDPWGHLLSETDDRGNFLADYVWTRDASSGVARDRLLALITPQKTLLVPARVRCGPGTLNLKSRGEWIECSIELPASYQPRNIDLQSVRLNGTVPAALRHAEIEDKNRNGIPALEVKFPRKDVQALLSVGEAVPLTLTGVVSGTPFSGTTTIRVVAPEWNHRKGENEEERESGEENEHGDKSGRESEGLEEEHSALSLPAEPARGNLPDYIAGPYLASLTLLELAPILAQTAVSQVSASEVIAYVHTDHLGTPVMMTDDQGRTVWEADPEPFGETAITADSGVTLNVRFPGQYYDSETGLHYNYFRDYDPTAGRYLQPDPLGRSRVNENLYEYVGNTPITFVDPYGLIQWGQAGSAALGVAGNAFGLFLGVGLGLVPEPTMVTKIAALAVVGKSSYGFGSNINNLVAAFRDQTPASYGALTNDIAALIAPGQQNAQRIATVMDLSTDLIAGRIAARAAKNALGLLYPYDVERAFLKNPDDLGPLATGLQTFDLLRTNYDVYSDLYKGNCK